MEGYTSRSKATSLLGYAQGKHFWLVHKGHVGRCSYKVTWPRQDLQLGKLVHELMKKPIDVADKWALSKSYWTLNYSTSFYLLSITTWGGVGYRDHILSLEFSEIDLFLLHLRISSPYDERSRAPYLRTTSRVLPRHYILNPNFYLLNWVFLDAACASLKQVVYTAVLLQAILN